MQIQRKRGIERNRSREIEIDRETQTLENVKNNWTSLQKTTATQRK